MRRPFLTNRLLWKLVAVNLAVLALVVVVVWLAINYLAAGYFTALMNKYHISPTETHAMFLDAVHRYLLWASLVALALTVALGFLLTRRILRPLRQMGQVAQQLGAGDYDRRVEVLSRDEVGELGTAFNRMAENLQQVEQLRKSLVADVAHELRTPLTNVRGYLEALGDGVIPPSEQVFAMLQQQVLRLVALVEDLLELAKADRAKLDLKRERVSLPDLLDDVMTLYGPRFHSKGIAVHRELAPRAQWVTADRGKLLQAVRNLIENAHQYTPAGGMFCIRAERLGKNGIQMTFANSGAPIAPEDMPLLFERFYRPDKSRSREHGGAGIGLAIVKALIEAHGGQVSAACAEGEVRFQLTLPA